MHGMCTPLLVVLLLLPSASARATVFGATLGIGFTTYSPLSFLSFTGGGSGTSSASGVTVPGGVFSGTRQACCGSWRFTRLFAEIESQGAGAFAGSPLAGPMRLRGSIRAKMPAGGPITIIYVPLLVTHEAGSAALSAGLGIGGYYRWELGGGLYEAFENTPWTAGAKTLTGIAYIAQYHVPTGARASRNDTVFYDNATAMFTGTDSRTPGGLGQVTLVSPTKVTTNLLGADPVSLVAVGTLTLEFVPEPGTLLLLGAGVVALASRGRRAARLAR
jgi:PEP-CTERM motif